jgi:RNA polymerase sigma factor (sigma-70 family)
MKSAALRHPARLAGASLLRLQSDARLAELAVTGHEAAFDAIVDRYRTPLMRYCAGIVGPSRAEDAVQQTLINAHEAMTRTDEVRHLKPWLYRIAHNAALNVLRAVKDDVPLDEAALGAHAGDMGARGPAESFERSEQFRETLAALQALPERQRAALVLRELEGRSHEEIAAALGVTKGSARQHLMRGRAAVRSAVTAVTPYPLVARLADMLSGSGSAGWVDAAAGAGASATLMKLGAGVAATGALVGGAVGTQHVVRGGSVEARSASPATERVVQKAKPRATPAVATPAALRQGATRATVERASSAPSPSRRSAPRKAKVPASKHAPARVAPASAPLPAVEREPAHPGRDRTDAERDRGRGQNDEPHGHRGADKPTKPASSGPSETKRRHGSAKKHKSGHGKAKPGSPTAPTSNGVAKAKGKDKAKGEAEDQTPAPASDDASSGSKAKGSGADDSATTTPATAAPPIAASDDDED